MDRRREKSEIRLVRRSLGEGGNSKSETKPKLNKRQKIVEQTGNRPCGIQRRVPVFEFSPFEFVSDFEFRILDFFLGLRYFGFAAAQ